MEDGSAGRGNCMDDSCDTGGRGGSGGNMKSCSSNIAGVEKALSEGRF